MKYNQIVIIGSNGQLGKALKLNYPTAIAVDKDELDITDQNAVDNFDWSGKKILLNAAAYTNVDGAETSEGRLLAWQINASAVANLAKASIKHNLLLVHISSDYVFNGTRLNHDENELFSPLGVYGQSKAAGDIAISLVPKHYLIRTSWVIGDGKNFVRTMIELAKRGINPSVVSDQIGRPTFTDELVRGIDFLIKNQCEYGTYNLSNCGNPVSWSDFTRKIYELKKFNNNVTDITTEEYFKGKELVSARPLQSSLDCKKINSLGFKSIDWQIGLENYLKKELIE